MWQDLRFSLRWPCRMPSSEMWRRVGLLWADVSEERVSSIFRVEKITRVKKSVKLLLTDWLQFGEHWRQKTLPNFLRLFLFRNNIVTEQGRQPCIKHPTWRSTSLFVSPKWQGGPVIPPGTGFPFCCLLWLAGLRWKYSNPPPYGQLCMFNHSLPYNIIPYGFHFLRFCNNVFFLVSWKGGGGWYWVNWVRQPLFGPLHQPWMMDDDECGAVGGMSGR
jgi:hypothetical protein